MAEINPFSHLASIPKNWLVAIPRKQFNIEDKVKIAQAAIDLALIRGDHPYDTLIGILSLFEIDRETRKSIGNECKKHIQEQRESLPFAL